MSFFVSRQCIWPEGILYVEISPHGIDHASADMLGVKFPGEGKEYVDPREAVRVAIEICNAWRKTTKTDGKRPSIALVVPMSMPEPYTYKQIRKWADQAWERLVKCPRCGDVVPKTKWRHNLCDEPFCSENCCNLDYEDQQKADGPDLYTDEG